MASWVAESNSVNRKHIWAKKTLATAPADEEAEALAQVGDHVVERRTLRLVDGQPPREREPEREREPLPPPPRPGPRRRG